MQKFGFNRPCVVAYRDKGAAENPRFKRYSRFDGAGFSDSVQFMDIQEGALEVIDSYGENNVKLFVEIFYSEIKSLEPEGKYFIFLRDRSFDPDCFYLLGGDSDEYPVCKKALLEKLEELKAEHGKENLFVAIEIPYQMVDDGVVIDESLKDWVSE